MKKILIWIFITIWLFLGINNSFANNSTWEAVSNNPWSLTSPNYKINVSDITPWKSKVSGKDLDSKSKSAISAIIKFLMIPFWVLSLFIITIWWTYMIFSGWQDEVLSKWKRIVKMWIISLVIALSSYIIVQLVLTLLYI